MSEENQDTDSAARLFELQGTSMEEVHRRSKIVYTREFLLARAELKDYKNCLTGFDPSLFRELEDDAKDMQEPWKEAGIMFLPNSGNIRCRGQFSGLDSSSGSWVSDPMGQNNLHVSACKSKDTAKRYLLTEKDDYSQLRKSEDPYRPPHTYQGGRTKDERKSHSRKTVKEMMDSGIQDDTQLEGPEIAEGEQLEIKDTTYKAESGFSFPAFKPFLHDYDSQLTQNNSKKANMSIITGYLNEEKSRMTLEEDPVGSLEVPSGCSSTVIEKPLPQSLMVNSDSEKGFSGRTCFNSSVGNIGFHMIQSYESIFKTEFNESLTNRQFNTVQSGSFNGIPSIEVSGLQHPFTPAYDIVSSSLRENNPLRTNHQGITPDAVEVIDSNNMEEDECTFDDIWSEIMEIILLEQEDYSSAAESHQTSDFKGQISLPDDHSLISSGNPANAEHFTFVHLNRSNNISHYEAEIHLPDQDSLITTDNLIAPVDRSISIDYLRRVECSKFVPPKFCSKAADYAEIPFPSQDVLATIDDIDPNHLKFMASRLPEADGTGMSGVKNEVPRPGTLMTSDPAKGSTTQRQEVPLHLDVTSSKVHQELHFHRPSLHNHCNSIHHEKTVCYPLNSFQPQTIPSTTFMDPVSIHCYPALQWYSCPNTVPQFPGRTASPKLKELCYPHVQYSRSDKPANFLQHPLPTKSMALSNLKVGKKQPFSLRHHQRTTYPNLTIANSAVLLDPSGVKELEHQMVDSTKPKHEPLD